MDDFPHILQQQRSNMESGMTGMTMDMDTTTSMDMGGGGMHMGGMKMYFHFGIDEMVLFKGWMIHDTGSLILSMVGIFLMAMIYEAMKFGRQWLAQYAASRQAERFSNSDGNVGLTKRVSGFAGSTPFTFWHILQTSLHIIQTFISYMLMMVFMTFNAWLCIAVILGTGAGYFAFGWRTKVSVETEDHCH